MDMERWLKGQGLSKPRERRYRQIHRILAERFGNIDNFTEKIIEDIFIFIRDHPTWSADTKITNWKIAKRILRFCGHTIPEGMKLNLRPRIKGVSDIISLQEIQRILDRIHNPKHKALVALLYDTGARPSEILNLSYYDIKFDEKGMLATLDGKTGQRTIRVISTIGSYSYVYKYWQQISTETHPYPFKMSIRMLEKLIDKASKKALIKRKVTPYIFRHSRATHLAKHLTEAQMRIYFGWAPGSNMPERYVHLTGRDLEEAAIRLSNKAQMDRLFGNLLDDPEFMAFMKFLYQAWKSKQAESMLNQFDGVL